MPSIRESTLTLRPGSKIIWSKQPCSICEKTPSLWAAKRVWRMVLGEEYFYCLSCYNLKGLGRPTKLNILLSL